MVVLTENVFRPYRGEQQEFVAVAKLGGGKDARAVLLEPDESKTADGEALASWGHVDRMSFRAYPERGETLLGSKNWAGPQPVFAKLSWQTGGIRPPPPDPEAPTGRLSGRPGDSVT
ncbi:MAG: hypothetical protein U0804_00035 [Gemmataceae bacterium]